MCIRDSNASYLRYLNREENTPFTVVSTGTWVISFSSNTPLSELPESQDMLANVDINGQAVACARFMGGREFEAICRRTGSKPEDQFGLNDIQRIIDEDIVALPDFSEGSGPFGGRRAQIHGRADNGAALASLYCALMLDYELDLLRSDGDLIIEGAWLRNPQLCALVAALRPHQKLYLSTDETGTVSGAALLALASDQPAESLQLLTSDKAPSIVGLNDYRQQWRERLFQP